MRTIFEIPMQQTGAEARAQEAQGRAQAAQERADVQKQVQEQIKSDLQAEKDAQLQAKKAITEQVQQAIRNSGVPSIVIGQPGGPYGPGGGRFGSRGNPFGNNNDVPPGAVDVAAILGITLAFCIVGLPIARAFARWIDRRGNAPTVPREVAVRLEAIEQAVESVAVEVERISEGQRFTTRVLSERTHEPTRDFLVPAGDAIPVSSIPANARRG